MRGWNGEGPGRAKGGVEVIEEGRREGRKRRENDERRQRRVL